MTDYHEIEHVSGTTLEVIPTPDAASANLIPPLHLANRPLPWWRRRLRIARWALLLFLLFATPILLISIYLIERGVPAALLNHAIFPNMRLGPTPFPVPDALYMRPQHASSVDLTTPMRLYDSASQQPLFPVCAPYADYLRLPILLSATGDRFSAADGAVRSLYMLNDDGTGLCYLTGGKANDAHAPYWDRSSRRFFAVQYVTYFTTLAWLQLREGEVRPFSLHFVQLSELNFGSGQSIYDVTLNHIDPQNRYVTQIAIVNVAGLAFYPDYSEFSTTPIPGIRAPLWSPDGERIAYSIASGSEWDIGVLRRDGNRFVVSVAQVRGVGAEISPIAWSPGSRFIAYVRDRREIWSLDVVTSNSVRIAVADEGESIFDVEWVSNDFIAFAATVDGERGALFTTDLLGDVQQLTPVLMGLDGFAWRSF